MKKLVCMAAIAMVLTVFNGCTKEELKTSLDDGIAKTGKADVYLENDYLVVKNFEAVDSLKKSLLNRSIVGQISWEKQLGFKSAKTFRDLSSEKLAGFENQQDAESYIKELTKEGYFSMMDSSLCYPFYNYSWDCILNKNGIVKIGEVLYCFQNNAQIAVLDGKLGTLNSFLEGRSTENNSQIRVFPFEQLKSTTPVNYGIVKSTSQYNASRNKRFSLAYKWEPITQVMLNVDNQWITVQTGNKYYLWFHNETFTISWWNDNRTTFQFRHICLDIGGNYDTREGKYYTRVTNMALGNWTTLNTEILANYYVDVYVAWFSMPRDIYSSYTGPTIYNYSCNGACDTFGGPTNPVTLTIN